SARNPGAGGSATGERGPIPVPSVAIEFHPDLEYFSRVTRSRGTRTLRIDAAGLEVQLLGLSDEDASLLRARYGPFVREIGDAARIEVVGSEVKEFLRPGETSPGKPEVYRLEQRLSQERLIAWSYDFAGFFDYAGSIGKLAIAASMGDPFH